MTVVKNQNSIKHRNSDSLKIEYKKQPSVMNKIFPFKSSSFIFFICVLIDAPILVGKSPVNCAISDLSKTGRFTISHDPIIDTYLYYLLLSVCK